MGSVVLDSSVLIALFKPEDKHHQAVRDALRSPNKYLISAISFTEVLPLAISKGKGDLTKLRAAVSKVIDVTEEVASLAAEFRTVSKVATPDAVISATAKLAKAELWTCDQNQARRHVGARLIA
jgi:predicted nucleic acid-binding protein